MRHRCNLAAKESGLECACVNNDDFTVLVRGGGRLRWVSMHTVVWLLHSKWLSKESNESASNFVLNLTIPLWKLFRWFRRLREWCNECSANKSVAQTLQRWSRICWKWCMFWKACNKQNPWKCWPFMGCDQRRLLTYSVRTRSWFGDSKTCSVQDFHMKPVMAKPVP